MLEFLQVLAAYIATDALTGVYHMATDRGFNTATQVGYFQKHHAQPWTMTFDLQPMAAGMPILILGCFVWPWFFVSLGVFLSLAQIPHYYTHHPAPRAVAWLQRIGAIISPAVHGAHHMPPHDRDYCIFTGWNNGWLNWVAAKLDARGKR